MATIDLSRSATDYRKHFTSARAQMGRVLSDDDQNDNERLHDEDMRRARVHIIGPAGSPDDGFLIKNPVITAGKINFDITPGTFYLGGHRLDLERVETFQQQSDWVNMTPADMPAPPLPGPRFDLVYLESWQQPVSAVEDSELFEVALAGPDTSARMRQMRRVRVFAGAATGDCHIDWATLAASWKTAGLGTLNDQAELKVDTTLTIGFVAGPAGDLCSPPVQGGYLGAENQAIRVQYVDASHFTWGFDNASPLYRVTVGPDAGGLLTRIKMETAPKDQAHWPVAGQIVEILPWSAVLANNEKTAEVRGFLSRVAVSYDPDTKELFLVNAVAPAGFGLDWVTRPDAATLGTPPGFFFMRVWNRGSDVTSPESIPFVNGTAVPLGNTGLTVTFNGADHHPDDFWIIAARPQSPNRVVPWLLESGRGPHGIRRFYTPLGVIQWTAGGVAATGTVIHDCRDKFPPLTRIKCCCTYTVGDGVTSFGHYNNIQAAIDALPAAGGEICLLPGLFRQSFRIVKRHDVSVHGCGIHTRVVGRRRDPVITIEDSQRIQIHDFAITAPEVIAIQLTSTPAAEANRAGLEEIDLDDLTIAARDQSAIRCDGGRFIRLRRNDIEAEPLAEVATPTSTAGKFPLVFVRADDVLIELNRITATGARRVVTASGGVQIGGGSERVEIRRNHIIGGNGHGITLGSVTFMIVTNPPAGGGGGGTVPTPGFGWTIDENGCPHPDPRPVDPRDPRGNPTRPVSDGDLYDIRILENDILDMGLNGISTLRYFNPEIGLIVVRDLDIEHNRIRRCVQIELGERPFGGAAAIGFGGVSLVAVEELMLRDNWIERNGRSFIDPICGVYVFIGRGFVVDGNHIIDNGPRTQTDAQPTAGPRGGIVILIALTPFVIAERPGRDAPLQPGYPAARIFGNTVVAPLGRALWLGALGLVSVEGNEFTSRGIDRDGNPNGVTVTILNSGGSFDLGGMFVGFANMAKIQPADADPALMAAANAGLIGGEVLFNDNQVLLEPPQGGDEVIGSSILIMTADDALMDGNQSECRLYRHALLANGFVFGWSVRVCDNRFEERLAGAGVSALTWAGMNSTTDNQGTRCFLAVGIPVLASRTPNRSLITLFVSNFCARLSTSFSSTLVGTGLDA